MALARHLLKVHRINLKEDKDSEISNKVTSSPAPSSLPTPLVIIIMTIASQATYSALLS
jgi:hypothetical protein